MEKLKKLTKNNVEKAIDAILENSNDGAMVVNVDLAKNDSESMSVTVRGGITTSELRKIEDLFGDHDILVAPHIGEANHLDLYIVPEESSDNI